MLPGLYAFSSHFLPIAHDGFWIYVQGEIFISEYAESKERGNHFLG
jgi:hypothetical protein